MLSELLPSDQPLVDEKELSMFSQSLEELRAKVSEGKLPEVIKQYIFQQLNILQRAVKDYPLIGIKAFRRSVYEGMIHVQENVQLINDYQHTEEISLLEKIQERAVNIANFCKKYAPLAFESDVRTSGAEAPFLRAFDAGLKARSSTKTNSDHFF